MGVAEIGFSRDKVTMRLNSGGATSRLLALLAALLLAGLLLALPAQADAAKPAKNPKVDASVEALVDSAPSPSTELRVIVFGGDLKRAKSAAGAKSEHKLGLVAAESMKVKAKDLDKLVADGQVSYVTADVPVVATGSTDFSALLLANLYPSVVGAPAAWLSGYTGAGVGIAIIDSGVTFEPDLGNRLVQVQLPGQTAPADDTYGHGTFVAGIAAGASADGRFIGIAPEATIYGIDARAADGSVHTSDVISALDWVYANHNLYKIRVVNLSLAENAPSSYLANVLDTAVERVWRAGVVVVTSAGNRADTPPFAPGNDPFVITVGAIDTNGTLAAGDDTLASFSSGGVTQDGFAKPELLAPGRRIASLLAPGTVLANEAPLANIVAPGYGTISGTSFAAPQVAGAAAILLQQHHDWSPDLVKAALMASARPFGAGPASVVDVSRAVALAGSPTPVNQGLLAATYGLTTTTTTDLNSATWNSATWNSATWNSATWNTATWNFNGWD